MLKSLDIEAVHDTLVYFYHMQSDKEMVSIWEDVLKGPFMEFNISASMWLNINMATIVMCVSHV